MTTRKLIIKKTLAVSVSTLLSKFLGIIRELLSTHYLGVSALSDAFITAWKIPSLLRKVFAEGAMSATFIPEIITTVRNRGRQAVSSLMTLGFIIFEMMVLVVCILFMIFSHSLVKFFAPGFSSERVALAASFLYILMPFLFLISTSALLAGALQAVGHFFVPAFGPVVLNIVYIIGLLFCLHYELPVTALCWFIMAGGVVQLIMHIIAYNKLEFGFGVIERADIKKFGPILIKFFWCFLSIGVVELGMVLDTTFASKLPEGSLTIIYYANRFMGIPLGVFAVAFSTILLPHFSRIGSYAPKRLGFYILETTKVVWWVTFPATIIMMMLANKFFVTIFLSDNFTLSQTNEAAAVLITFLVGLFFFAINKILLNVYYALHETMIPGIISVASLCLNALLNWMFMRQFQTVGLAAATTIAAIIQTIFMYWVLSAHFKISLYTSKFIVFMYRYAVQIFVVGIPFIGIYWLLCKLVSLTPFAFFFTQHIGYWLWVGPLCLLFVIALYFTREKFKVHMIFLGD